MISLVLFFVCLSGFMMEWVMFMVSMVLVIRVLMYRVNMLVWLVLIWLCSLWVLVVLVCFLLVVSWWMVLMKRDSVDLVLLLSRCWVFWKLLCLMRWCMFM